jgi:Arc/MetJ family transcription regulator
MILSNMTMIGYMCYTFRVDTDRNRRRRPVHRTTIDIDVVALEGARRALGTSGYRDTVNEALRDVDRRARLRQAAAAIRSGGLNLVAPEDLETLRPAGR